MRKPKLPLDTHNARGKPRTRAPYPGEAPPKLTVDLAVVERAASIGCTLAEIATLCHMSQRTVDNRVADDPEFAATVERGRNRGRATLRRLQWQSAESGNITAQIWLGKNLLGQRDNHAIETTTIGPDGKPVAPGAVFILKVER